MALRPPERTYTEPEKRKGPRDVDAAARAQTVHALGWALYAGLPMGIALGGGLVKLLGLGGVVSVAVVLLGIVGGPLIIFGVALAVAGAAGKGAGTIYMPSGRGSRKKEYSRAVALAARGEFQDAIISYEAEILDDPTEPEPYLRIARICRDNLKDHDEALAWFKRATREAELSGGQEIRSRREMAEIYLHHRREPRRAAPELARLAEAYPDTPDGQWAARELAAIKEEMAGEE